jgi:hypothetical protein
VIVSLRGAANPFRRSLRVALLCLSLSAIAEARELVILVQPSTASRELREAFNRLRGELLLHGFSIEVVTVDETISSEELSRKADAQEAIASVSFTNKSDGTQSPAVEIWISDRVTGKTTSQTIVPESAADTPTVISVRALELLRASLREFASDEPDVKVQGAHPERAAEAVQRVRVKPPPVRSATFGVGVATAWSLPQGDDSYGPELSIGYVSGAFGARMFALGPFQGGRAQATLGSVAYQTFSIGIDPLLFPVRSPRWTLGFFPSAGVTHLGVHGEIGEPYRGTEDGGWLFTAGGGAEGAIRFGRALEIYVRGRGFWLLPSPTVILGPDVLKLSSPSFTLGLGVRLSPGSFSQ